MEVKILISLGQFFVHCKVSGVHTLYKEADKHIYKYSTILLQLFTPSFKKGIWVSHIPYQLTFALLPPHQRRFCLAVSGASVHSGHTNISAAAPAHGDTNLPPATARVLRSWALHPAGRQDGRKDELVPEASCLPSTQVVEPTCSKAAPAAFPSCVVHFATRGLHSAGL